MKKEDGYQVVFRFIDYTRVGDIAVLRVLSAMFMSVSRDGSNYLA